MAALDAVAGQCIGYPRQGVLIGGGNNRHRADIRADPAPCAEILVNKNRGHLSLVLIHTGCPGAMLFIALEVGAAPVPYLHTREDHYNNRLQL